MSSALRSAAGFVVRQPFDAFHVIRSAALARLALPLDVLRWLVGQLPDGGAMPSDLQVTARPPALHIGATVNMMDTLVRAQVSITVEALDLTVGRLAIALGLSDLDLEVLGESTSMVASLLNSGALDLSRPGKLLKMMPEQPPPIVEIRDHGLTLDLAKVPGISANATLNRVLGTVTPVANIKRIFTERDMLVIELRLTPTGLPAAIAAARA